jgi:DNA topoisomerase I
MPKSKNLVIVESPAKAKTISHFLGKDFVVKSSYGHVRDLPKSKMGIETNKNFEPQYVVPTKARKNVNELKKLAENSKTVYLATDEDREGEAIAWHLLKILDLNDDQKVNDSFNYERIVFHEITEHAVKESFEHARKIDQKLVDAQQARRILDRLVGYELSPFLWKKVRRGLSAGRVQSVAVRLIVEKEREIQAFKPEEYWTIEALFEKDGINFEAKLHKIDGKILDKFFIKNEKEAKKILDQTKEGKFVVEKINKKKITKKALAPFTTSTLQQTASTKLGFSGKQTMTVAQKLYEGLNVGKGQQGLITYMRTDSVNLSDKFCNEANIFIKEKYGSPFLPDAKNFYKSKTKNAQEAHEAIRPTDVNLTPDSVKDSLESGQYKLYRLIWQRAVASQMSPAVFDSTSIDIINNNLSFRVSGSILNFPGYLQVYDNSDKENILPEISEQEILKAKEINPNQHFTEPPARYNDASIVKKLEELGIGRPSTYAPTISTVIDRGYIEREEKKLIPEEIAFIVNDLLVEHFPEIIDYHFTAKMEDNFDEIAGGDIEWQPIIKTFYDPFKKNLIKKETEVNKDDLIKEETDEICDKCNSPMKVKLGRFGKFLACSNYPDCKNTKPIESEKEKEEDAKMLTPGEKCLECGKELIIKHGRFGKFVACSGYPDCKYIKKNTQTTGLSCPECNKGKIAIKKSKKGKVFYACSSYPDCKYALWNNPIEDPDKKGSIKKCQTCDSSIVEYGKDLKEKCSNKDCQTNQKKKK